MFWRIGPLRACLKNVAAGILPALERKLKNLGPWQSFHLLRANGWNGPFLPVAWISPTPLGNGEYRFTYPLNANAAEFFRVEGM